ncbi:ribosomal protein L16 Arg81 hydroxylase [Sphingomonas sp. UYP23]
MVAEHRRHARTALTTSLTRYRPAGQHSAVRYPALADATQYDVILEPGEILFMPLGWWHQVKSLDFSITLTFTNFRWANDAYASYPAG